MPISLALQRLLALALLLVGLLAVLVFVILPYSGWRDRLSEEIGRERALVEQYRRILAEDSANRVRRTELAREREEGLRGELIGGEPTIAVAELQQTLRTAIETQDGQIRSMRVLPILGEGGRLRIGVAGQIEIDHEGLRDLLFQLETGLPVLFVEELEIRERRQRRRRRNSRESDGNDLDRLDVELSVFGYLRVEDSPT